MPAVTIKNIYSKTIHCESKTEKLIDILLSEVDWMHACGKKGRCTTCTARVLQGAETLGAYTEAEIRFVNSGKLKEGHRLACQAVVTADVTVAVLDLYKLPHQNYSE